MLEFRAVMRWLSLLLLCSFCSAQKAASGPWLFTVRTSPMDDSKSYVLHTSSVKTLSDSPAELILRCSDGSLDALVATNEPVEWDGDVVPIRTRLDKFAPSDEAWDRVESDRGFILTDSDAEKFVKDMAESKQLKLEYTSLLKQHRYVVTFDVSGLKARLSQLRGCMQPNKPPKFRACITDLDTGCTDNKGVFHPMGRPRQ